MGEEIEQEHATTVTSTGGGTLSVFIPYEVKEVKGSAEGEAGDKISYRVTKYSFQLLINDKVRKNVKWSIKIGDNNKEDLTVTGEEIELEIKNEWIGKEILVMPYLSKVSEKVSVKTWCYILKHNLIKNDSGLNRLAVGETVDLNEASVLAVCKALDTLIVPYDSSSLNNFGRITSIKHEKIVPIIKLFQNEYMDEETDDDKYEDNCTGEMNKDIIIAMDKALIDGWEIGRNIIGSFTNGTKMIVRYFGTGKERAIFLIGGLHSDELGGRRAIKIMKEHIKKKIKEKPDFIPENTTVFVLNPASVIGDRLIGTIDPNRAFSLPDNDNRKPKEVITISKFLTDITDQFNSIIVISGHSGWEEKGREGNGTVFPLYKLTNEGKKYLDAFVKKNGKNNYYITGINIEKKYFTLDQASVNIRRDFSFITKFIEVDIWRNEVYNGELISFLDKNIPDAIMIEFETPKSLEGKNNANIIGATWGRKF